MRPSPSRPAADVMARAALADRRKVRLALQAGH